MSAGYVFNDAAALAEFAGGFSKVALFCDEHTENLLQNSPRWAFLRPLLGGFARFVLPAGERAKSWQILEQATDFLCEQNLSRRDLLLCLGGGVVSDLGGFAAAIYKRGCAHANIPTTLLAAADAGIGGKTGINNRFGKNLIGAFKSPERVFVFTELFATLDAEALACGWAEIIKMAAIFDAEFFAELAAGEVEMVRALSRAAAIKRGVVERDWLEAGERALLNYGHTFAHAIELESAAAVPHGQAVAAGMLMADELARELGLLGEADAKMRAALRLRGCLQGYAVRDVAGFCAAMARDKKNLGAAINFVLRTDRGAQIVPLSPDDARLAAVLARAGAAGGAAAGAGGEAAGAGGEGAPSENPVFSQKSSAPETAAATAGQNPAGEKAGQ